MWRTWICGLALGAFGVVVSAAFAEDAFQSAPGPDEEPAPSAVAVPARPPQAGESGDALFAQAEAARRRSDYGEAMGLFRAAAEKGNHRAAVFVGLGYQNAWGVPKDYTEAMRWFRKAADSGDALALHRIAWLYQNGWGVQRDYTEAMRWYRLAADKDYALSFNNIGVLYDKGWGVPSDHADAMNWFQKAAERGNSWGMRNMGWATEHGLGIAKDANAAIEWYRRAAALREDPDERAGAEDAKANLARLGQ